MNRKTRAFANRDVICQRILALSQLMSPVGVPNGAAQFTEAIANGIGKICEMASSSSS